MIATFSMKCNTLLKKTSCLDLLVTQNNEFPHNLEVLLTTEYILVFPASSSYALVKRTFNF